LIVDIPTKPVEPLLGQAIEAWQAVRPAQPPMLDCQTNEYADFLFAHRARRVAPHCINKAIVPMLCRKAGVPSADVRGNITSHRPGPPSRASSTTPRSPRLSLSRRNG
jgi:hypothetical protein